MLLFFRKEPTYKSQFKNVWMWASWPGNKGRPDTGIDLVAENIDGTGFTAIQCKNYSPTTVLEKADIDSFTTITELNAGTERTVRANFDLNLKGYIVPDIPQKDLTVDKKRFSKGQIVIQQETIANLNDLNQSQINKPIDTRNPQNTDTDIF